MAGVQPEIISAAEDSATYATSQPIEKGQAAGMQVQLLSENHGRRAIERNLEDSGGSLSRNTVEHDFV